MVFTKTIVVAALFFLTAAKNQAMVFETRFAVFQLFKNISDHEDKKPERWADYVAPNCKWSVTGGLIML